MTEEIISRAEARASGLNHYFTGLPCKHGHLVPRYVYSTKCVACIAGYHERNKELRNERSRARDATARSGQPRPQSKGRDLQNLAAWLERTKEQRSLRMKAYNDIPENKARKTALTKAWQEKTKERRKAIYLQNRDEIIKKQKDYRDKNKKKIYTQIQVWNSKNWERVLGYSRKRKAMRRNALGSHTVEEIQTLLVRQKFLCAACKTSIKKKRHLDHIIPLVAGGSNSISNLQWLCPTCNCSKKDRDPIVFFREKGFLL